MSQRSDVVPFLTAVAAANSKPLQAALPQIQTASAPSPWSPQPTPVAPAPVVETPQIDVAAITAQAMEDGRAEGFRETEALRAKLIQMIDELDRARQSFATPATELVADAAATIVEAWVGASDRKALFAPIVAAWIASGSKGATARCHPSDVETLRAAIGEAAITVTEDPSLPPGDIAIADATRELAQAWEPRLRELREAIAGALSE
jgi:flagellar biosynthesis/type III secretory pathway protein FliH